MNLSTVCTESKFIQKHCRLIHCIYNCACVDLFLLGQCVINEVYVCLSCLKVIGQYTTWRSAHS